MHKVNSCCCGCSLRTGTLIILSVSLVLKILVLLNSISLPSHGPRFTLLIVICIAAAGIYGVNTKKPVLLVPYMVLQLLELTGVIILMLVMIIASDKILEDVIAQTKDEEAAKRFKARGYAPVILAEIMLGAIAALFYYLFIVVLSYFKQLRSETQR